MNRLTEKEQDYYRLNDYRDPCKAIDQLGRYEDIGFSPEELQEIVDKQKWHVVAEGDLPEETGHYLLQREVTNPKTEIMPFMIGFYRSKSRTFPLENHYHHILAWRELPEPWEERMK